jgi:hypothetical protein
MLLSVAALRPPANGALVDSVPGRGHPHVRASQRTGFP